MFAAIALASSVANHGSGFFKKSWVPAAMLAGVLSRPGLALIIPTRDSDVCPRVSPRLRRAARPPGKRSSRWRWLIGLTLLAIVGIVGVRYFMNGEPAKGRPGGGERGGQPP